MDDIRTGARFRALRQRLGWRQRDLAMKAGVSPGVISLIERGRIEEVMIRKLRLVARELDAEFVTQLRWRGGDLDRLVDEAHAHLVGRVTAMLREAGWDVRIEVSYAIYGERGSIDVLGWHPAGRLLLVIEVKSELVAIEETLRKHDQKARLAPRIAAEQLGWTAVGTTRLLVLPSLSTARRRVERHSRLMATAYSLRGAEPRRWLAAPGQLVSGLLFMDPRADGGAKSAMPRKRIRPHATRASPAATPGDAYARPGRFVQ